MVDMTTKKTVFTLQIEDNGSLNVERWGLVV
jgi:hypothetical protein